MVFICFHRFSWLVNRRESTRFNGSIIRAGCGKKICFPPDWKPTPRNTHFAAKGLIEMSRFAMFCLVHMTGTCSYLQCELLGVYNETLRNRVPEMKLKKMYLLRFAVVSCIETATFYTVKLAMRDNFSQ